MKTELSRRYLLRLTAGASVLSGNGLKGFEGIASAAEAPVPMDPKQKLNLH